MTDRTRVLVLASGNGLDVAGELGAVLGAGFEVSLVRAANRQTVELVLDGVTQFGIVHIQAHGATSVLDFGGERMREAELVSLIGLPEDVAVRLPGLLQRVRGGGRDSQHAARAGDLVQCADRGSGGGGVCAAASTGPGGVIRT